MSVLAPSLEAFFTDRLIRQRRASPETVAAYRDALRLLLVFAVARTGTQPSRSWWGTRSSLMESAQCSGASGTSNA